MWILCISCYIKAAIILVINFNAAHAIKGENERFDKRAVLPRLSFRLVSSRSTIHLPHSTFYRISFWILLRTKVHTHVVSFYTSDTFKVAENEQNRTLPRSFSLILSHSFIVFHIFIFVSLDSLQKGLNIFIIVHVVPILRCHCYYHSTIIIIYLVVSHFRTDYGLRYVGKYTIKWLYEL